MAKSNIEVAVVKGTDKVAVGRLVESHGSLLMAGVDANRRHRGVAKSRLTTEGYVLYCTDKKGARKEGFKTKADYLVLGYLADSAFARALPADPDEIEVPLPLPS